MATNSNIGKQCATWSVLVAEGVERSCECATATKMNALFLSKGLRGKAEMASLVSLQESQNSLNDYSSEASCTSIKSLLYNHHHPVMASHATLDRYWMLEKVEQVCTSLQQSCLPSTQSLGPIARASVLQLVYEVLQCKADRLCML